jgi:PAS domain S-box-containing protein
VPDRRYDSQRDIILDSIADGVFTVDDQRRITSFDRAAERITGVERAEATARRSRHVIHIRQGE